MDYSEQFLRGVSDESHIGEGDSISSAAFYFTGKKPLEERTDGNDEESIFWRDDEGADELILGQKKADGKIQFKAGAVIVDRSLFDNLAKFPLIKGLLGYERHELPENKYHGNLLLKKTVDKRRMQNIAGSIATLCCVGVIKQKKD